MSPVSNDPFPLSDADIHEQLFHNLFREYEQKLYVFVVRVLRSEELARDIIQDVFLKLWTLRDQLPHMENVNGYVYRMAENRVYDYLRAAATQERARKELWNRLQGAEGEPTDSRVEGREYAEVIQRAINQLPPQRKLIYLMNRQEGMKYKEIASELNISPHTVRNQLSEAFQQVGSYVRSHFTSLFYFLLFFLPG